MPSEISCSIDFLICRRGVGNELDDLGCPGRGQYCLADYRFEVVRRQIKDGKTNVTVDLGYGRNVATHCGPDFDEVHARVLEILGCQAASRIVEQSNQRASS